MKKELQRSIPLLNLNLSVTKFKKLYSDITLSEEIKQARSVIEEQNVDVLIPIVGWRNVDLLCFTIINDIDIPVLFTVRNSPSKIDAKYSMIEHSACMLIADKIHVLLPSYRNLYPSFLQQRIHAIPNTIQNTITPHVTRLSRRKRIVGIGRFDDDTKKFSILIQSFSLCQKSFPDWDLTICGDGPSMGSYRDWIRKHSLESRIILPGAVTSPETYLAISDIFCIPSAYEGFPNVLLEAQQAGLPCVGFSACLGVNEIIVHEMNGLLANKFSAESLAQQMRILMRSDELRLKYGTEGRKMLTRYDFTQCFDAWERLIRSTPGNSVCRQRKAYAEEIHIRNTHASMTKSGNIPEFLIYELHKRIRRIEKKIDSPGNPITRFMQKMFKANQ
jgi:glycosyltransferase involved in cell wall biosynthesis